MSTRQYATTEAAQPEASGELDATEAAVLQAYTAQLDNLHLLAIQYALDTLVSGYRCAQVLPGLLCRHTPWMYS